MRPCGALLPPRGFGRTRRPRDVVARGSEGFMFCHQHATGMVRVLLVRMPYLGEIGRQEGVGLVWFVRRLGIGSLTVAIAIATGIATMLL